MRTTYHELVGTNVIDKSGKNVGKVADLRAEDVQGHLRVTGLLVGEAELLARFGLRIVALIGRGAFPGYFVPWQAISSFDKLIRLRVDIERLEKLPNVGRVGYSG